MILNLSHSLADCGDEGWRIRMLEPHNSIAIKPLNYKKEKHGAEANEPSTGPLVGQKIEHQIDQNLKVISTQLDSFFSMSEHMSDEISKQKKTIEKTEQRVRTQNSRIKQSTKALLKSFKQTLF